MGGCATKPKVVKGDDRDVPAPEPTKEPVAAVPEGEKVDVDDEANKKESTSNLLDENEKKEVTETPLEATKIESTETKAEPLSIESKEAAAAVDVGETQNKETSSAAKDEEGKSEVAK